MNHELFFRLPEFDLTKLSKTCNYKECVRFPSQQAVILEVGSSGSRELVDIYFCSEHYQENIDSAMEKIRSFSEKGLSIEKKVFDIGYVTY